MLISSKERQVEFDLVWLYNHSDADCGIKSNYMAMVNVACYGPSTTFNDPFNSFILKSVEHKRKLESVVSNLPPLHKLILFKSFADIKYPKNIELLFNKYTGAATVIASISFTNLDKLSRQFYQGTASDKDKILISQIRTEATTNYYEAINQYLIERKKQFKRYRRPNE